MKENKFIGVWTIGMMNLSSEIREKVEKEFNKISRLVDDWFYEIKIDGQNYFVAENGEIGYTAMLPEEY